MRPDILFPLFRPVTTLKGVGPRLAKLIERAAGGRMVDLAWHLPTGIVDRRHRPSVAEARDGAMCTLSLRVDRHQPPQHRQQPQQRAPHRSIFQRSTAEMPERYWKLIQEKPVISLLQM